MKCSTSNSTSQLSEGSKSKFGIIVIATSDNLELAKYEGQF